MDKRLYILHHLYTERQDPAALRRLVGEDEALRQEVEVLAETKRHLDRRPPRRPDAAVIDQIVAAAGPERAARLDRPPARPARRRAAGLVGTTFALLLLAGLGLWQLLSLPSPIEPAGPAVAERAEEAEAPVAQANPTSEAQTSASTSEPAETSASADVARTSGVLAARSNPAADRLAEERPAAESSPESSPEPSPESSRQAQPVQPAPLVMASAETTWDDAGDVRRLHRRIALVQSRSRGLAWDDPLVEAEATETFFSQPVRSEPMMLREQLLSTPPMQPRLFEVYQPLTPQRNR